MKRLIGLLLVIGMLLTLLAACKNGGNEQTTTDTGGGGPVGEEETEYYLDTLPSNDYGENEFRIVTISGNVPKEAEQFGNEVQRALYERDLALMDRYTVEISYEEIPNAADDEAMQTLERLQKGEDGIYHAYITSGKRLMSLATKGILQDMHTIDNLDLEQKWWNQSLNENCAIGGALYCSAGPYSEYYYHAAFAIAYNRTMAEAYGEEDIYGYVTSGEWTIEKMKEICTERGVTTDNGDSVWDKNDLYAIAAFQPGMYGLFAGAGGQFSTTDADGNITVSLNSERSRDIIQKLANLFAAADKGGDCARQSPYNNFKESAELFTGGKALFLYTSTGYINDYLPSTINYGILPLPKYDESQTNYITCAWAESNYCLGVPAVQGMTDIDRAFAGLMIEAYCYLSYEMVRPVKYDKIMKYQVATDESVSTVMDLIFDTLYFDANLMFDFGSNKEQKIEGTRTLVATTIFHNSTGEYSSKYDTLKPMIETALNELLKK